MVTVVVKSERRYYSNGALVDIQFRVLQFPPARNVIIIDSVNGNEAQTNLFVAATFGP